MTVLTLSEIGDHDGNRVGGKAAALARLSRAEVNVPTTLCLPREAYECFVNDNDLRSVIVLELGRKPLQDLRWEELWDASLRIRNRFIRAPFPENLQRDLEHRVRSAFGESQLVVRSSAPGEDSAEASFAGLHDSIVGVAPEAVMNAVRRVYASLWSDRALLYRQELGLNVESSSMAVVIQALVRGDSSGVAFSVDPTGANRMVVEAVHGLNQGLVDGNVQPDRWFISRNADETVEHQAPPERLRMVVGSAGLEVEPVPNPTTPLSDQELRLVCSALRRTEKLFGGPQDMEWTIRADRLVILQARPITTGSVENDQRAWYLGLTRSLDNLKVLRNRVEHELLPMMDKEAADLAVMDLEILDDRSLANEIVRRQGIEKHWVDVYWREFIPLAHGVRLFGQVYNDVARPEDPFEFMDLLAATPMLSLERNQKLERLAEMVRASPELASEAAQNDRFTAELDVFIRQFGAATVADQRVLADRGRLLRIVSSLAEQPPTVIRAPLSAERFLEAVAPGERPAAEELLELARASYRLRDDDNIHLAAIKAELLRAADTGRRRLDPTTETLDVEQVVLSMRHPNTVIEPKKVDSQRVVDPGFHVSARQIVGQPAGPGVAVGSARIVDDPDELFAFQAGEIIVCDAVEPNMTFIVPLAAAVVERRGGMLIHGAIIAREYGLPCVTGVPGATQQIRTGDRITVDGFLGIVTLG